MLHRIMDDHCADQTADFLSLDGGWADPMRHGARAVRLARLAALDVPTPPAIVLPPEQVEAIAAGGPLPVLPRELGPFLALRGSTGERRWGGPQALLNIGLGEATLPALADRIGERGALEAWFRAIRSYGVRVEGLDAGDFDSLYYDQTKLTQTLTPEALEEIVRSAQVLYEDETGEMFPEDRDVQLAAGLRAMAREWASPSARILRQANGAPEEAGLAIIVQKMIFGLGDLRAGAGSFQTVDSSTGMAMSTGRYLPNAQGGDAGRGVRPAHMITEDERRTSGQTLPSFEVLEPEAFAALKKVGERVTAAEGDALELQFSVEGGALWVLDAEPARRSSRAAVQVAVDLARAGIISREDALLRIDPRAITETLHAQIDPSARRDVLGHGLPASPGAVSGVICFSGEAAMAADSQGERPILVRVETSPDDIRGMHSAAGVLTARGGMTSHAAVIARGLGLPCIVGAGDLAIDTRKGRLRTADGRVLVAGETITLDGATGEALAGTPEMIPPIATEAVDALMDWADDARTLGIRANADTAEDAALAKHFKVDGIGLCRTEHMFFEGDRINLMREMILADTAESRQRALDKLLPLQREGFAELFTTMAGLPVTIRLLDPPLHEFLPSGQQERAALARAMDLPVEVVSERAEDLSEFNPMLGKRGVRLGITMPEIYDMQTRAIFEAAQDVMASGEVDVHPEIMIPLVSAVREVEIVKARVDAVAAQVAEERGREIQYQVGVMVETPRGALRAGDLAKHSGFLSLGTNDLTQMTYGLSRDDAGRFMRDYVNQGVFPEDPFQSLDLEGVGELVLIAARRARATQPDLTLGLCGEHGGDPESIRFCKVAGFDYVSCSPFRVPVARLAAAQATILTRRSDAGDSD